MENRSTTQKEDLKIVVQSACSLTFIAVHESYYKSLYMVSHGQQLGEKAGLWRNYSTTDHIFGLNSLLEYAGENKFLLHLLFVDFEKAFDSVVRSVLLRALEKEEIDRSYVEVVKEANAGCSTEMTLFTNPVRIPVWRGHKEGDSLSPKLLTSCLEMFRKKN